jgi:hypothetical protein
MEPLSPILCSIVCPLSLSRATWIQSTSSQTIYVRSILTSSAHLSHSSQRSHSFRFPHQNPVHILFFTMTAICPAWIIILILIIQTISGNQYKLWCSSSCNFRKPPVSARLPHHIQATHT